MIEIRFVYVCDLCGRIKEEVFEAGPITERFQPNPLAHGFTFLENGLFCTKHLLVNLDEVATVHERKKPVKPTPWPEEGNW